MPPVAYAIACLIQRSLAAPPRNQPLRRRWPGEFEVVAIVHVRSRQFRLPNFGSWVFFYPVNITRAPLAVPPAVACSAGA